MYRILEASLCSYDGNARLTRKKRHVSEESDDHSNQGKRSQERSVASWEGMVAVGLESSAVGLLPSERPWFHSLKMAR